MEKQENENGNGHGKWKLRISTRRLSIFYQLVINLDRKFHLIIMHCLVESSRALSEVDDRQMDRLRLLVPEEVMHLVRVRINNLILFPFSYHMPDRMWYVWHEVYILYSALSFCGTWNGRFI